MKKSILAIALVGLALIGIGLVSATRPPSLEDYLTQVTGSNAVPCGRHQPTATQQDMVKFLVCGIGAMQAGKPFRIIEDVPVGGPAFAMGLLGTADGNIIYFRYDAAPCFGLLGCAENFSAKLCALPLITTSGFERDQGPEVIGQFWACQPPPPPNTKHGQLFLVRAFLFSKFIQ